MKRINYIFVLLTFCSFSCNDFLEVVPRTQIPSEAALTNGKNVEATLLSAYGDLASDDFLGLRVRFYSELLADNIALDEVTLSSTDFTGQVALRNTNILNKDVDNVWVAAYRAIAKSNNVIGAIDDGLITDNTTAAKKNEWKAEALFIRAVAHFELVRLFGKPFSSAPATDLGVPLRIKSLTQDEKLPRATVAQVYDQVIADLVAAAAALPENNGNRADEFAAKGYLARVYFNKLDYAKAFETSKEIIDAKQSLSGTPLTPFRNNGNVEPNGEVLFQLVSGGNSFGAFRPASNQWSVNKNYELSFGNLAERSDDFRFADMLVKGARTFSTKWDANVINPPIIRLAEIYLIHAESAAAKTPVDLSAAAASYNTVRKFADQTFPTAVFATADAALSAIREERRAELLFEGDRYHELKRLKTASFGEIRVGQNVIREAKPFNDASWLLKIPVSETSGNPAIVQN